MKMKPDRSMFGDSLTQEILYYKALEIWAAEAAKALAQFEELKTIVKELDKNYGIPSKNRKKLKELIFNENI